ncbi:hypothetical protein HU200_061890 [Digitaria exilis]|uniref:MATH domain-containing protein n=1 Tax=Digitaria exilis TaxID=1010633 RepID=A0A835E054_9POAL|nr:hypothetical protein HU200_061890 [Digitaria exilis]
MFNYCSFTHQFKLSFQVTKTFDIGQLVSSGDISAEGHLWRIKCYPRGTKKDKGDYLSVFLHHQSATKDAKAIFEVFVMDTDGAPSSCHRRRLVHVFKPKGNSDRTRGWSKFVKLSVLESLYSSNGWVIIMCGVKVVRDDLIGAPPSDIASHLGILLDSADGSDVSFVVNGEEFPVHRVCSRRSSWAPWRTPRCHRSITLQEITSRPSVMVRFIYTDEFPSDAELGDSPTEKLQDLFMAADRFALDDLKLLCTRKLWDDVSADTIGATLAWAETYSCLELKKNCIDFLGDESNFRKAVLTDGFIQMVLKFPSVLAELRVKVWA